MIGTRRTISSGVLAVFLLLARHAAASPIIESTVTPLADGTFQYSYSVTNPYAERSIYDVGLTELAGEVLTIGSPTGWDNPFVGYDPLADKSFIDWFSALGFDDEGNPTAPFDIQSGQTLTGFVFTSLFGPGQVSYLIASSDLSNPFDTSFVDGMVDGPVPPATPVPEPGTMLLVGTGVLGVWRARRRRQSEA